MICEANPHRERHPAYHLTYWDANAACGKNDPWTRLRVESVGNNWSYLEFDRESDISRVLSILRAAFNAGGEARAYEIRKALGVSS